MEEFAIYLVVDQDGSEWAFESAEPIKSEIRWLPDTDEDKFEQRFIELPKGTIEQLIKQKWTFDNGAYKYTTNIATTNNNYNYNVTLEEMEWLRSLLTYVKNFVKLFKKSNPEKCEMIENFCNKLCSNKLPSTNQENS